MLSKHISKINFYTKAWFIFHIGILTAFIITLFVYGGFTFDADYTTMMPSANQSKAAKIAEKAVSGSAGSNIFILAGHPDFEKAKSTAENVYNQLKQIDKFKTLNLYADLESMSDVTDFLAEWRSNLISPETQKIIQSDPSQFAQNSLAKIYSGITMAGLDNLDTDPFLIDDTTLLNYLQIVSDSGTAMSPKSGVLASEFEGKWYVLIRADLTVEGARMASRTNAIPDIYRICFEQEDLDPETRFAFYGTNFHSYKSSSQATKEVTIISTVVMIFIIIMLLVVFKSLLPLFASIFQIIISVGVAFIATHAVFGNIHMMSIIFGTSLIGSCIDYSLHFFINWKSTRELDSGDKIRKHLFNGLFLSLVSTELCYLLLMFAPFTTLKQISVFSFTGILSSFLTTTGLFPMLKLPAEKDRHIPLLEKITHGKLDELIDRTTPEYKKHRLIGKFVIFGLFAVCLTILTIRHDEVKVQNDIGALYNMEGRLRDDTILAYQVMQYDPTSWLIVSGDSAEEVLQAEEEIIPLLPDAALSTSRFIPSINYQKKSQAVAMELQPLAKEQLESLGFEAEDVNVYNEYFQNSLQKYITPEDELPGTIKSMTNLLWIGQVEDKFYSIILPSKISDEQWYMDFAAARDDLTYQNKVKDISLGLDKLTRLIVMMFGIAFVIIAVIMKFFYNLRDTTKIVSIPLISILVIITTFVLLGIKIEFFCITGVILVFGLGLDYVIYKRQNNGNKTEAFAITLSFITTAVSFGAIILTSFVPVHVLGLSIFSGLVAAFVCTFL